MTAATKISGADQPYRHHRGQPEIGRGKIVLLHDLDHAGHGRAPVTFRVVTSDERARPLAGAVQQQAELDVIDESSDARLRNRRSRGRLKRAPG